MANHKQRLELTWIGKDNRPRLEPRILIEDPAKSFHASFRGGDNDQFGNRLIFGDNLPVLEAQEFASEGKCVFVGPVAAAKNVKAYREHWDNQEHRRAHE